MISRILYFLMLLLSSVIMIVVKFISHISGIVFGMMAFLFLIASGTSVLFGQNLAMAKDFLFGAAVFLAIMVVIGTAEGIVEAINSILLRKVAD